MAAAALCPGPLLLQNAPAAKISPNNSGNTSDGKKQAEAGATITYQLPYKAGQEPVTWRVTLAIVDAKDPNWIISQFVSGAAREVNAENQGKFTEIWDGLDDNYMPIPPGTYGVKGIYMPAKKWGIDNEFHTITPRYLTAANSFQPPQAPEGVVPPREPFSGDPVGAPMADLAAASNGVAVFYYQYLENGTNNPMIDLKKEIGYDQFLRSFNSGGAGGGGATCTDGTTVWSYSDEGGAKYVYRADGPWGTDSGAHRNKVLVPPGRVTSLECLRLGDEAAGKTLVYIAQRGKMYSEKGQRHTRWKEGTTEWVNKVTIHDGTSAAQLGEIDVYKPAALAIHKGNLYVLHIKPGSDAPSTPPPAAAAATSDDSEDASDSSSATPAPGTPRGPTWVVSRIPLKDGLPAGTPAAQVVLQIPADIVTPGDITLDAAGNLYVSDTKRNKVLQFGAATLSAAKITKTFGKLDAQVPGKYDKETFMAPTRLTIWPGPDGKERLLVLESAGPNRVSEWSIAEGKLIRDWVTLQTKANDGYANDPDHPEKIYLPGHQNWLVRWKLDYAKRDWQVDAVWPYVTAPRSTATRGFGGIKIPRFIRIPGENGAPAREYIASGKGSFVYRHDTSNGQDRWVLSAGIVRELPKEKGAKGIITSFWHDANNNQLVDDEELTPTTPPQGVLRYHGDMWLSDLSLAAIGMGSPHIWRVAPEGYDAHGNPIFKEWKKLLTDPIFEARANGTASATHGANELANTYSSDWGQVAGDLETGFYVNNRGGQNFSANYGAQHKISRYVPDGKGGYKIVWRTGRQTLGGTAAPGQIQGAMHTHRPLNGLLSLIDQSRSGVLLYTDDGLYVDTLFPDNRNSGVYSLPGEFFAGAIFPNKDNGQIYIAMGKYTPLLFAVDGWSLKENPVRPLDTVQKTVSIAADQIATPSELVLSLRGGAGAAKFVNFAPAIGGVALDGTMGGWESTDPVEFSAGPDQKVQVRCAYDADNLYLRWQVRTGTVFDAKPLYPIERIFTHDRLADTLSFYIQGDSAAKPAGKEGRPGDVRFVFGIFKDEKAKPGAPAPGAQPPAPAAAAADAKAKPGKEAPAVEINTTGFVPVVVGMYPKWPLDIKPAAGQKAAPQIYATEAGGTAKFDNVAQIPGARLGYKFDRDGKGYVLAAAIPRSAVPMLGNLDEGVRTMMNFEATLSGHTKFWWSNADNSASRETYDEPTEARLYPTSWSQGRFTGLDGGVVLRHWQIIGPFGGPGAEAFAWNIPGEKKNAAIKLLSERIFPVDEQGVDLGAVYTGEMLKGYWPPPREARWRPATVEDLDTRVSYGKGAAEVWFGTTWVYAPEPMELDVRLQGHTQTTSRFLLNGTEVFKGEPKENKEALARPNRHRQLREIVKPLTLNAGWNQFTVRGFCVGYSPFRLGVVLDGPKEKLWKLKLSNTPPPAAGGNQGG